MLTHTCVYVYVYVCVYECKEAEKKSYWVYVYENTANKEDK